MLPVFYDYYSNSLNNSFSERGHERAKYNKIRANCIYNSSMPNAYKWVAYMHYTDNKAIGINRVLISTIIFYSYLS